MTQPVDDDAESLPCVCGPLVQEAIDHHRRRFVGVRDGQLREPGFAVDADPQSHAPLGDGEERSVRAGQGGSGEGDTQRAGPSVRQQRDVGDVIERPAVLGGPCGGFEDDQVPSQTAASVMLIPARAGDVIRDGDAAARDAVGPELSLRAVEIQHIAGVVAVGEENPRSAVDRARDGFDLRSRR